MDKVRSPRHGFHREVRFDRIRDVRIDRYNAGIDRYVDLSDVSGDFQRPERNGDIQRLDRNGDFRPNRNGDVSRNDSIGDLPRFERRGELKRDVNGELRIESLDDIRVERNGDIRTCTMPALTQEAPPVVRRRDKNKKDNSANRRSRPASWFVSHFSFDKLFHRGKSMFQIKPCA